MTRNVLSLVSLLPGRVPDLLPRRPNRPVREIAWRDTADAGPDVAPSPDELGDDGSARRWTVGLVMVCVVGGAVWLLLRRREQR